MVSVFSQKKKMPFFSNFLLFSFNTLKVLWFLEFSSWSTEMSEDRPYHVLLETDNRTNFSHVHNSPSRFAVISSVSTGSSITQSAWDNSAAVAFVQPKEEVKKQTAKDVEMRKEIA